MTEEQKNKEEKEAREIISSMLLFPLINYLFVFISLIIPSSFLLIKVLIGKLLKKFKKEEEKNG